MPVHPGEWHLYIWVKTPVASGCKKLIHLGVERNWQVVCDLLTFTGLGLRFLLLLLELIGNIFLISKPAWH